MFKTWLCANFGIVYLFCALVLLGIAAIFLPIVPEGEELSTWLMALLGIGAVSCVFLFACEPGIGPVVSVIALASLYIYFVFALKHPEDGSEIPEKTIRIMNTIVISLSVVSAIPAFFVARYANINFYDVVSRRWLYRNSAKDVFESTWKYTFNRFCMAFLAVLCLLIDLAIIIVLIVLQHSGSISEMLN